MDLYGFILLTRLAEHVSVDLWKYQTADGQGIHKAIDWLVPYAAQEKKWTYQQIEPGTNNLAARIFDVAHHQYGAEVYGTLARKLDPDLEQDLSY